MPKTVKPKTPLFPFSSGSSKRKPTSPAKNEDHNSKKLNLMEDDQTLDQGQKVDKIFEMLIELQPIIRKLEDFGAIKVMEEKVQKLDREMEKVKRELIASNVVIMGIPEKKEESHEELEQQVERVFSALDIGDIDYGRIRRQGKSRVIQVKLVRETDKVKILKAKKTLRGHKDFKDVYINPELTPLQQQREARLRETAKDWKETNKTLKYHIRRGHLFVTLNMETKEYKVNEEGQVEEVQ